MWWWSNVSWWGYLAIRTLQGSVGLFGNLGLARAGLMSAGAAGSALEWSREQVGRFLSSIGQKHLVGKFELNGVDGVQLLDLTESLSSPLFSLHLNTLTH